jgi:hypothetical protein
VAARWSKIQPLFAILKLKSQPTPGLARFAIVVPDTRIITPTNSDERQTEIRQARLAFQKLELRS